MAEMRYREALGQALAEEMERDETVFLMGEDIGVFNGAFKVTNGLLERFGRSGCATRRSPRTASPGSGSARR